LRPTLLELSVDRATIFGGERGVALHQLGGHVLTCGMAVQHFCRLGYRSREIAAVLGVCALAKQLERRGIE